MIRAACGHVSNQTYKNYKAKTICKWTTTSEMVYGINKQTLQGYYFETSLKVTLMLHSNWNKFQDNVSYIYSKHNFTDDWRKERITSSDMTWQMSMDEMDYRDLICETKQTRVPNSEQWSKPLAIQCRNCVKITF